MKKYEDYVDYVKEFIIEELPNFEGQEVYGGDICYMLTEGINADGTATYSTHEAIEYIRQWFYEAADFYQYQLDNYGEVLCNPFENPERWMVWMIIEGVANVLSQCEVVNRFWNHDIKLTDGIIEDIIDYVKEVEDIEF